MINTLIAVGAAVAVLTGGHGPHLPTPRMYHLADCYTWVVPAGTAGDAKAAQLLQRGWTGDSRDGAEQLLSPGCFAA